MNATRTQWELNEGLVAGREYKVTMETVITDSNGDAIISDPVESVYFLLGKINSLC